MKSRSLRITCYLTLAVVAATAGIAGFMIGAQRLGQIAYGPASPSWIQLVIPLLLGALLETVAVAAGGAGGMELSSLLRERALEHALHIDPDQSEISGTGTALARALDADLVGSFLVTTGPSAILGTIEAIIGIIISSRAPDGPIRVVILSTAAVLFAVTARHLLASRQKWTQSREIMTAELVDRLIGQRTVALQEDRTKRDGSLRRALRVYGERGRDLDTAAIAVTSVVLTTGTALLLLALKLRIQTDASTAALAIAAALLVITGMMRLSRVVSDLVGVQVAREQQRQLAAMRLAPVPTDERPSDGAIIDALAVVGEYSPGCPVVGPIDLRIEPGETVLLSGESGSGKTTLVEILNGRRPAARGSVRRGENCLIVRAPQAGDDHMFHASLLFNIALGTTWPPQGSDVQDALALLHDLALAPLVERMPAGIVQPVGDGGWRLSAGETARIRLARALIRRPDLLILDETFAALDAATFHTCLKAAEKWAGALLVVSHT